MLKSPLTTVLLDALQAHLQLQNNSAAMRMFHSEVRPAIEQNGFNLLHPSHQAEFHRLPVGARAWLREHAAQLGLVSPDMGSQLRISEGTRTLQALDDIGSLWDMFEPQSKSLSSGASAVNGVVYAVKVKANKELPGGVELKKGEEYALKEIVIPDIAMHFEELALHECLKECHHVVKWVYSWATPSRPTNYQAWILMEKCLSSLPTMSDELWEENCPEKGLTAKATNKAERAEFVKAQWAALVSLTWNLLEETGVYLADIKPDNMLVKADGSIVYCDLGMAHVGKDDMHDRWRQEYNKGATSGPKMEAVNLILQGKFKAGKYAGHFGDLVVLLVETGCLWALPPPMGLGALYGLTFNVDKKKMPSLIKEMQKCKNLDDVSKALKDPIAAIPAALDEMYCSTFPPALYSSLALLLLLITRKKNSEERRVLGECVRTVMASVGFTTKSASELREVVKIEANYKGSK